jgi:hypothetical protein
MRRRQFITLLCGVAAWTQVVGLLLASLLTPASAQSVDPSFYYKLSTQFRGNGMKLDVFNGGPKNNLTRLEPDQDVSGQFWRLVGNTDGTFRLSTLFRGPSMCLDIFTVRKTTSPTSSIAPTSRASSGTSLKRGMATGSG